MRRLIKMMIILIMLALPLSSSLSPYIYQHPSVIVPNTNTNDHVEFLPTPRKRSTLCGIYARRNCERAEQYFGQNSKLNQGCTYRKFRECMSSKNPLLPFYKT
ncbi:hypothetical protein PanWU01x14_106460 [Parasponia andersonii]|uniref:Uncharacterized protein n=1 Tax=Parasponia andersonii TaxID=3476 RepID=A0A2P5D0P7_PARAD|nr:hypothetical protein PanWU01x14_106460 [Parasponia andersonii]